MTERERLAEKLTAIISNMPNSVDCIVSEAEYIADRLLADDEIIVSPVKIGQTVYPLHADPRFRAFVERIEQTTNGLYFDWVQYDVGVDCTECWDEERFDVEDIGKTVFLTKEDAEKALAERSEGK